MWDQLKLGHTGTPARGRLLHIYEENSFEIIVASSKEIFLFCSSYGDGLH